MVKTLQRTHGKGNTKNKRGAGCRGGRGRAGSHKHKYSKYYMDFGGKKGLKAKPNQKTINLSELNEKFSEFVEKGFIKKSGKAFILEQKNFPFEKIMGKGELNKKIEIQGIKLSKKAKEKLGVKEKVE